MADCVTSLGGVELRLRRLGGRLRLLVHAEVRRRAARDVAGGGVGPRAGADRGPHPSGPVLARSRAPAATTGSTRPAAYHHTAPVLHIYALHEALREVVVEGLPGALGAPHARPARYLQEQLRARGLRAAGRTRPPAAAADRGAGPGGRRRQAGADRGCCASTGSRSAAGSGPAAPSMWRIGLMGYNARIEVADRVLAALDAVLADEPALRRRRPNRAVHSRHSGARGASAARISDGIERASASGGHGRCRLGRCAVGPHARALRVVSMRRRRMCRRSVEHPAATRPARCGRT